MGLERTFCNHHRGIIPYSSPLPPIPDSPRVYRNNGNPGTEAVVKVMQVGAGYVFTREPVQVHVIVREITVLNALFSIEEIEQRDPNDPFRKLVLNVYKPWLEQRPRSHQINAWLNVLSFIESDMERMSEETEKIIQETREIRAKTRQTMIELDRLSEEADQELIEQNRFYEKVRAEQKEFYKKARAEQKKIYEEARVIIDTEIERARAATNKYKLQTNKNIRTNLIITATLCLMVTLFFFIAIQINHKNSAG